MLRARAPSMVVCAVGALVVAACAPEGGEAHTGRGTGDDGPAPVQGEPGRSRGVHEGEGLARAPECDGKLLHLCSTDEGFPGKQACVGGAWGPCEPTPCSPKASLACATPFPAYRGCEDGHWADCLPADCHPGDSESGVCESDTWTRTCSLVDGAWRWVGSGCGLTPLVLAFDDRPVRFTDASGVFDLSGDGVCVSTAWVSSATPWLALDLDGDGAIGDGAELFGSMTRVPDGRRAAHGFVALASWDADGDGWITANDPVFDRLLVWRDVDQDRASSPAELRRLADEGVVGIELAYAVSRRCAPGGCEVERARVSLRGGGTAAVVDVHLDRAWRGR